MRNIVLIGLPGSGKSTLGAKAARILNLGFLDLDSEIERRAGLSVAEVFKQLGENQFRAMEAEAVLKAAAAKGCLIATGGGVITSEENRAALKQSSRIIFLDRPVEKIIENISDDGSRPLIGGDSARLHKLAEERRDLYLLTADISIPNQGSEEEALETLLAIIRAETATEGYAVIGEPITHSLSPVIHEAVFNSLRLNCPYRALHVPSNRLASFVARVRQSNIKGFNVTIPHKRAIMPMLDEIDQEAELCGAVNTVVHSKGRLTGFNTDMSGLEASLRDHGCRFSGREVLILGAGGSAGSIAFKAARAGSNRVTILARHLRKAEETAERIRRHSSVKISAGLLKPESMAAEAGNSNLVFNCTPLGMHGLQDNFQSFAFLDRLPKGAIVCDLIYNPARTNLLREAEKRGLTALNGLGMLIHQAILADEHYLNKPLKKDDLYKIAAAALNKTA